MSTSELFLYAIVLAGICIGGGWCLAQWFALRRLIRRKKSLANRLTAMRCQGVQRLPR
jgi:hypothetical protein